jgi:hypothetical protein
MTPPLEETYQIVSNNFTLLRDRNLLSDPAMVGNMSRELNFFVKTFIDPSVTTECLVLDVYVTPNGTYEVVEWNYGSVRSTRKVIV